ncbi:MAG TPA: DNA sulfur modification protein DndD [Cyanobacteria bacterium UBA11369]|nr:DNA sulfur modification protein DndD [Cyanobacteria bacterium UBA11371]HBE51237.1 DNA sulfur modification protein DndD [Cyanobacteria bacterium UBA11369]
MKFIELVLQNFGPYQGRQVIDLRPEKDNEPRPIILFGGMNGGGKTTLMDAIRLALYGQRAQCSTRGNLSYSDFLSQCVNNRTSPIEDTRIELLFEQIQEDRLVEYRIVRHWTKNPKDGKDNLGILEGEYWPSDLAKNWDDHIENILPIGISNLFLFDGEQVKELAELETPPPMVVEAIQSLLGLELAERLSLDLDILATRKRKALADSKQLATIEEIEEKLTEQTNAYNAALKQFEALQAKLEEARDRQNHAQNKFISEGGKIAAERSQLDQQLESLKNQSEKTRESLVELAAGAIPVALISPLLEQANTQAQKEARQQELETARNVLKARDERLLNYIKQISLIPEQLEKIESFIRKENQALDQEDLEAFIAADAEIIEALGNLMRYQINTDKNAALYCIKILKELDLEITSKERELAAAAAPEAYAELETAVKQAQTEYAKALAAYEAGDRKCKELAEAIAKTKKELTRYSEQSIQIQNDQHIINASAKVQATLKLFKQRLTLRKLNKLEGEVTECFRYLLHKSDLVHRVVIDTHTFSLSLYDPQGQAVPKHRLSAGEKQLLAIAFLWGLARVSGRRLPVAIDTPLGRLDSSHRSNLVERYFPSASHQVILLSTDTEIGETEVDSLRKQDAIAREYLLKYNPSDRHTNVEPGYFW